MACPICSRPTQTQWRPFCSKRCADVDLGRWLTGGYALPGGGSPEDAVPDGRDEDDDPPRRH